MKVQKHLCASSDDVTDAEDVAELVEKVLDLLIYD